MVEEVVTLKGPQRTVDLKVRDPEQFKLIAKGDQVEAKYTQALAIAVALLGNFFLAVAASGTTMATMLLAPSVFIADRRWLPLGVQ